MVFGIDIDDTIINTSLHFEKILAKHLNVTEEYLLANNIYYINVPEIFNYDLQKFEDLAFNSEIFNIPAKKQAIEVINKLKRDENKIILITARSFNNACKLTKEQLKKLKLKYDKLIFSKDKKTICINENVDVFIDDSITNLTQIESIVKKVILFSSNYNITKSTNLQRMDSWDNIFNILKIE